MYRNKKKYIDEKRLNNFQYSKSSGFLLNL